MERKNHELYEKAKFILEHSDKKFDEKNYNSIDKILEELNIYHVELEIQNEELRLAQNKLSSLIEKYTSIFNYAPIGYIILSEDLDIIDINTTALMMLGINKAQLNEHKFSFYINSDYQDKFYFHLKKLFEERIQQTEYIQIKTGNKTIDIQIESVLYKIDNTNQIRCALTDISKLKNLEKEIIEAKNIAEQSSEVKSLFLSNISHELLTPLNAISGFSSFMIETDNLEEMKDYAKIINNSTYQLITLVNNILAFKDITTEHDDILLTNFDLIELINSIIEKFNDEILKKGLIIQKNITTNFNKEVYSDRDKIKKIFYNLISNAIKFTEKGKIEINLSMIKKYSKNYFNIEIVDSGIGIEENKKGELFQLFNQLDNSLKRRFGGLGLGLILTKELVKSLGGYISFVSEKNVGSKFYVTIPYQTKNSKDRTFDDYIIDDINIILVEENDISLKVDSKAIQTFTNSEIIKLNSIQELGKHIKKTNLIFVENNLVDTESVKILEELKKKGNTYLVGILDFNINSYDNKLYNFTIRKPFNKNNIIKYIIDNKLQINIIKNKIYEFIDIEKISLLDKEELKKSIKTFSSIAGNFYQKYNNRTLDVKDFDMNSAKIFINLCNTFLKEDKIKYLNDIIERIIHEEFINQDDKEFTLHNLHDIISKSDNELLFILYKKEKQIKE